MDELGHGQSFDADVATTRKVHVEQYDLSGTRWCAECNVEYPCATERIIRHVELYRDALVAIRALNQSGIVETEAHGIADKALHGEAVKVKRGRR